MVAHQALNEVDRLEAQMTVYRDDSEIAGINRDAFGREVQVEEGLFELLRLGIELHRRTRGAFDFTAGALARCWGFHQRQGRLPGPAEIDSALRQVGSRHVTLNRERSSIRFSQPLEINLGAIGKGFALDRAAAVLRRGGLSDCLLHAGHSSVLALGSNLTVGRFFSRDGGDGWRVGVRHPLRHDRDLAVLALRDRAFSTSGIGEQSFQRDGRRFGHILDPRTGWPAEGRLSVSVVAATAAQADALSTAFFVMATEEVEDYCRRYPGVGALLVSEAGDGGAHLDIQRFGLERHLVEVNC